MFLKGPFTWCKCLMDKITDCSLPPFICFRSRLLIKNERIDVSLVCDVRPSLPFHNQVETMNHRGYNYVSFTKDKS